MTIKYKHYINTKTKIRGKNIAFKRKPSNLLLYLRICPHFVIKCGPVRRRCITSIHRGLSRSKEFIFNQDFQGLFIYIIILVLCCGYDGELGEIIMTFSFMKNWGKNKGIKTEPE